MAITIRELVIRTLIDPIKKDTRERLGMDPASGDAEDGKNKECCEEEAKKAAQQEVMNQMSEMIRNEKER